jgi:hypothetical protein
LEPKSLPVEWQNLDDKTEDELYDRWFNDLLGTIASRGRSELLLDLSDNRGLPELLSLPECRPGPRPLSAICDATPEAIRAVVITNATDLVQTVDAKVYLTLVGSWDAVFLHVNDAAIVERFREPVLRR